MLAGKLLLVQQYPPPSPSMTHTSPKRPCRSVSGYTTPDLFDMSTHIPRFLENGEGHFCHNRWACSGPLSGEVPRIAVRRGAPGQVGGALELSDAVERN